MKNLDEDCKGGYSWQLPRAIKKIQTFASHFPLKFIVFTHENNGICPWVFSSWEICRKPTGQNIAGSFFESRNSKSVSQRRQHSIERDADLHVDIGCLKKRKIFYDRGKQIHIKTYRRFLNFCLADSMNSEKYSGHDAHRDAHVSFGGVLH